MNEVEPYYNYRATGRIWCDPMEGTKHWHPWWMLLSCDNELMRYYGWLLRRYGVESEPNRLWDAHISAIKGEEPERKDAWKQFDGQEVEFWYSNNVRWDNGRHAWLDVFCPRLWEIRVYLGLSPKDRFHLTIGNLK